jgi:hypothetical protein
VREVARAWSLRDEELAQLLAYPTARDANELIAGRMTFSGIDRGDRARLIYQIHDTLATLFVDPEDEGRWLRTPLPILDGIAPLARMLDGRIPGMVEVLALIEQRMANW